MGSRFWRNGFIFFEQFPVPAQGVPKEEPEGILRELERGLGGILAMTRQQVVMDLLFGQVRRGTPVVPDQALHGEQIPLPGHRHHARQFHIGEKLAFQGADGRHIGEGRDGTLRGGTALTHGSLLKTRGLEEDARPNAKQQPRSIEPRPVHGKPSWRKGPSHRETTNAPKAPTAQPFSATSDTRIFSPFVRAPVQHSPGFTVRSWP